MACYAPLTAYYAKERNPSGKRGITFSRGASMSGNAIRLPCGKCHGCRMEQARQWAMRCYHEGMLHKDKCFVTLTYDDVFLPPGGTLVKRDLQLFMKRLRKYFGGGVRFFAAGEYGEVTFRPHYHLLLFGCDFDDKQRIKSVNGRDYFCSKVLRDLWNYGNNIITDVTFDSACYVARYVMKKVVSESSVGHYSVVDGNGEVHARAPEFCVMSRRPGIGDGYYRKYGRAVRDHDSVVINGRECRPPRFYDTRTEAIDQERYEVLRLLRKRKALSMPFLERMSPDRRRVREAVSMAQIAQKVRGL